MENIKSAKSPGYTNPESIIAKPSRAPNSLAEFIELATMKLEQDNQKKDSSAGVNLTSRRQSITLNELETFPEFNEKRRNISQNQLEWIYRHRYDNGFEKAFRKIGKLRYVVIPVFTALLLGDDRES